MAVNDLKRRIYDSYVSKFKRNTGDLSARAFSDTKLIPLLQPWTESLDRLTPCLDLGCGDGNILNALKTLGFKNISGVDLSKEQVELARTVVPDVTQGDALEYIKSTARNRFGLITLFDVIEHLGKAEILELTGSISAALKPGGVFICHCPNGDSPFVMSVYSGDLTHETILNATSAKHLCELNGLTDFETCEHLGASGSPSGFARRCAWAFLRATCRCWNAVETGTLGPAVLTRNFAFRAMKGEEPTVATE
jgi:2-polyprenyl-3-methyl-5-hydroxy-6-metoxy-1,4-benzoquinol methylase